jgi:hypothetical protein
MHVPLPLHHAAEVPSVTLVLSLARRPRHLPAHQTHLECVAIAHVIPGPSKLRLRTIFVTHLPILPTLLKYTVRFCRIRSVSHVYVTTSGGLLTVGQDDVSPNLLSGYMLPKVNWPAFVKTLEDHGLVFTASLSPNKTKSAQNRDHINKSAFDILFNLKIAVVTRNNTVASRTDAAREQLFGLASVSQVKDQRLDRAHMLTITPDRTADVDAWGVKSLHQRYPCKKVGYPGSQLDDRESPIKSIFLLCTLRLFDQFILAYC